MRPVLAHWSALWPVIAIYAVVAGAHLAGALPGRRGRAAPDMPDVAAGRRAVTREVGLFQAGLLLALLAIVSPMRYWSGVYIWVRALQDLLLAVVAPGLIVLGAPWAPLARSLGRLRPRPEAPGQAVGEALGEQMARSRPWWLRRPVATVVAFNVIWLGWHVPALFDRTPVSAVAAAAEYVLYLAAGILFWLQVIGSRPWSAGAAPLRAAELLVGTLVADTILGMVLVFGSGVLYHAYANPAHHVMTVLDDQQLAGAVLWMGMLPPMIAAAVGVLIRWLNDEESHALSTGIDRLLTPRSSAWPSRPRFR
jgi:putative membrane protein